jgi:vacuolar-type H+-ATPase subunit I/STV1
MTVKPDKERKKQPIVFSKEIDRTIGGTAVGMAFITVSLFLTFYSSYIINETVTLIFVWLTLLLGIPILLACLFSKTRYDGRCPTRRYEVNSNHLGWCAFLLIILIIYHLYLNIKWLNIISVFIMFLLAFLVWQELLFLVCVKKGKKNQERKHSTALNDKTTNGSKKTNLINVLSVISSIASIVGLGIAIYQLISNL